MVVKEEVVGGGGEGDAGDGVGVEPEGGLFIGGACIGWTGELLVRKVPTFFTPATWTSSTGTVVCPSVTL